ncbi:hypothetical protein [Escherichia phage Henu7]|uniref:Uncharacterized protein n=1 Tax=Escherichia phage Henu7 TaxID=2589652 RepID=A0A5B8RP46_9CAUD|nr:hypothetical protein KMB86_gp38 [Escherichia phage Henu7]QEA09692.1 hypothetical protein [Escherichia phage Henu7]
MKYYVRPTVDGENFTAGKLYEIQRCFGGGRFVVLNDAKEEIIVRCDGIASARLNWRGRFECVSIPSAQEAVGSAQQAAAQAFRDMCKGSGWRIEKGGVFIASSSFKAADKDPNVEVLEKLREILRVPDGENILTHAKVVRVLADGLINLQK